MHSPVLLIFSLMTFIAFCDVTSIYQKKLQFKSPILVGIFLSALVVHGSLQGWWIEPVLMSLGNRELFVGGMAAFGVQRQCGDYVSCVFGAGLY